MRDAPPLPFSARLPLAAVMLLGLFLPGLAAAQGAATPVSGEPERLFKAQDVLTLRIEADFYALRRDREEDNEERAGRVVLVHADGPEETFPAQVRTRGRFRLQSGTCQFPPLRINFPKGEVRGSIFDGQDKIKLVTHCRDSERYEQNVVKEYLVYRMYNVLTPLSLHVRMAQISYVDTSGREDTVQRLGFFIEMEESMADRIGGEILPDSIQLQGLHPSTVRTEHASRVALFQYMVGNTDFSIYGAPGTAPHNSIPVRRDDAGIIPVPYDFDWTGFVNAPYARPDPSLGTRRVRQRVFRGLCRPGLDYDALAGSFLAVRSELTAVVRDETLLTGDEREEALDYLEEFWDTLQSQRDRTRRIEEACRPA